MKKIVKKISILLVVLAFAMLFKCSKADETGDKVTIGLYNNLIEGEEIILVSPNASYDQYNEDNPDKSRLLKTDLEDYIEISKIETKSGEPKGDNDALATGDIIYENDKGSRLVLCGDANGDGDICDTLDVNVVIKDYLKESTFENFQKLAANLYNDDKDGNINLNVFDINRMHKKYLGDPKSELGTTLLLEMPLDSDVNYKLSIYTADGTNELVKGGNLQLRAKIEPYLITNMPQITFSSGNTNIATVDENGLVTGVNVGETTITATTTIYGETLNATINIKVNEDITHVTELQIEIDNSIINVGDTAQITATVIPDNATYKNVTFASQNESVATVDQTGRVTAVAVGTTIITATIPEETGMTPAQIEVTVSSDIKITNIKLNPYTTVLVEGENHQLSVVITPENATNKKLNWTSSDENVATVDSTGLVNAIKKGSVTITGKTTDGSELQVEATINVISENE